MKHLIYTGQSRRTGMRPFSVLTLFVCLLFVENVWSQTGCPGCVINLPPTLPVDTLYLPHLPDGQQGEPYDEDIPFRMPKTTTPVAAVDSTTPPGLTINKIEIISVDGLPPGLNWQPSQTVFNVATQTDGCIKLCGTPTVSDSFVLIVKLKATVLFISQETTFPLRIYIAPSTSSTDGFSMVGNLGCGSTTVEFTNNLPSNGANGFEYVWDFGDGTTFEGENPPPHTYSEPGVYPVNYHATIDTSPYVLTSIRIFSVGCVDELGLGSPDLYAFIRDANGQEVFNSGADVNNASLPLTILINLPLGDGNYVLEIWDEDSGLKGGDDQCGVFSFNLLSNDTLNSGSSVVYFNIQHPIEEVTSTDSVVVYPQPEPPLIDTPKGTVICEGEGVLPLQSSYATGNQWFVNNEIIPGATEPLYVATASGTYHVHYTSPDGCVSMSDSVVVTFIPLPAAPVFSNFNNRLRLLDTLALPAWYGLQWLQDSLPIPGATGFTYCTTESGNYGLQVTDSLTGCQSFYYLSTAFNPNFDCTVGTADVVAPDFRALPNPASDLVRLEWGEPLRSARQVSVTDATGRRLRVLTATQGSQVLLLPVADLPAGWLVLQVNDGQRVQVVRVVVQH